MEIGVRFPVTVLLFPEDRKHSETQKNAPFSVVRALALDVDSRERLTRTIMDINENVQNDNGNVMKKCFHSSAFNIFRDFSEKSRRFEFEVCFLNFQVFSLNFEKILKILKLPNFFLTFVNFFLIVDISFLFHSILFPNFQARF